MGVLITGGNGFIGKKLVDYLAKDFSISITPSPAPDRS